MSTPEREELLARVASISTLLDETAPVSEKLRTLCPEAVAALHEQGLFGLWTPIEAGGYDVGIATQLDVLIAVARADMSACWTLMIGASSAAILGAGLSEQGLAQVFTGSKIPTSAASLRPAGKAQIVEGGMRVTGKWGFGSGIQHASWIIANCIVFEDGKPVENLPPRAAVVPIEQVDIIDDWYVSGLRGSGSNSYSVDNVFVPDHLIVSVGQSHRGGAVADNLRRRLPIEHAAVSLGGARRALDEVVKQAGAKHRLLDPHSVASKQAFQLELGKLEAQWETLYAGVRSISNDLWRALKENPESIAATAVRFAAICAYATEKSLDIGNRAMRQAGAAAVLDSNVMQRIQRDLTVSAQHVMISDANYENYGKSILGLST